MEIASKLMQDSRYKGRSLNFDTAMDIRIEAMTIYLDEYVEIKCPHEFMMTYENNNSFAVRKCRLCGEKS